MSEVESAPRVDEVAQTSVGDFATLAPLTAKRRLGGGFDLRQLHRHALDLASLDLGSLGLDPLRRALPLI